MRYLRKYLQQVGLVSTLLIGGVLGGLMAPLTSEAAPTVTLKVDNGAPVSILSTTNTSSTCTAAELTLGFTQCYAINTTLNVLGVPPTGTTLPERSYLVRNAPGATARLRVADNPGQDKLSLIGVQFVPAPGTGQTVANWGNVSPTFANTNETHVLTITQSNTFDNSVGVLGDYVWAIRAGGEFRAGPTATGACAGNGTALGNCNPIGNSVTYPGTGTFNPTQGATNILSTAAGSTVNTKPLSLTVAGPAVPIVSFDGLTNPTMGQVNPAYPTFLCDDNGTIAGGTCKPTITQTMTVTLKGPDSFVLVNGQDAFGANCTATLTATQQKQITFLTKLVNFLKWWESLHHSTRLEAFIALIQQYLDTVNSNATGAGYDHIVGGCSGAKLVNLDVATAATADQVAFAASGAVSVEPAPQTGTITITKNTSQGTSAAFDFEITGPSSSTASISMGGQNSKTTVVTVDAGTYSIAESPTSGWTLNNVSCGENGDPVSDGVVGVQVPLGANVTCTFNNNKALSSYNYQRIDAPSVGITWTDARAAAKALLPANSWDLATITSAAEQAFIQTLFLGLDGFHDFWIGGEQQPGSCEPGGHWQWINGEGEFWNALPPTEGPCVNGAIHGKYQNWGTNPPGPAIEPNNNFGPGPNNENHVTMDSRYGWGWNDFPGGFPARGYVAERVSP